MSDVFNFLKDNLPVWFMVLLIGMFATIKFGTKFLKEFIDTHFEWREKSDALKNEYIAVLKAKNDRLQREQLEKDNEIFDLKAKLNKRK
jgi:hypothetical protein